MNISADGFQKVLSYWNMFKEGLLCTVYLSFFTVLLGFILAIFITLLRMTNIRPFRRLEKTKSGDLRDSGFLFQLSKFNPISLIATVYVEVIRATPMLVQLFIIYQIVFNKNVINIPSVTVLGFIKLNRFLPGVIALAINSAAYLSEIIRAGIQSVDIGQTEASRSLGLSKIKTLRYIVLPQAIKNILPAIGNEFVTIIKESAITYTIGVQDLMAAVKAAQAGTFLIIEPLLVVAVLYFCLTFPTSKIISYFERRMSHGDKR